jgi:predicted dehydrogenase
MADKLRVAFAGVHRSLQTTPGGHNWGSAFAPVEDVQVVAAYDAGQETREQFCATWKDTWGTITPYDNYQKMLDEVKPDILCLATRQTYHADQIVAAVNAGVKGIVCDKPLVTTLEEVDRIFKACEDAKVPFAYGTELRWGEPYMKISDMVRDGAVGKVTNIIAYAVSDLINHGCHWYDTALHLVGDPEPVWVSGLLSDMSHLPEDDFRRGDPTGRASVGLDNGAIMTVLPEGGKRSFTVIGDEGRIDVMNEAEEAFLYELDGETKKHGRPQEIELPKPTEPWPRGPATIRDLVNAMRTGGQTACDIPGTRRATEIGFAIHESDALGGARVELPVTNRTRRVDSRPWGNEEPS